jgi:hypothetical protein
MKAAALLRDCARAGISVKLEGQSLRLKADRPPPAEIITAIKAHKAELIALLITPPPPPSVADFEERASILEESGELCRAEANKAAALDMGYPNPRAFYSAVIHSWRKNIEAVSLPAPASNSEQIKYGRFDALKTSSLKFLESEFALAAVSCGWDELALFGVHEGSAPVERIEAYGLMPLLAWSVLGLKLSSIGREHAVLTSCPGATLKHPRFRANFNEAVPWWAHPQFSRKD